MQEVWVEENWKTAGTTAEMSFKINAAHYDRDEWGPDTEGDLFTSDESEDIEVSLCQAGFSDGGQHTTSALQKMMGWDESKAKQSVEIRRLPGEDRPDDNDWVETHKPEIPSMIKSTDDEKPGQRKESLKTEQDKLVENSPAVATEGVAYLESLNIKHREFSIDAMPIVKASQQDKPATQIGTEQGQLEKLSEILPNGAVEEENPELEAQRKSLLWEWAIRGADGMPVMETNQEIASIASQLSNSNSVLSQTTCSQPLVYKEEMKGMKDQHQELSTEGYVSLGPYISVSEGGSRLPSASPGKESHFSVSEKYDEAETTMRSREARTDTVLLSEGFGSPLSMGPSSHPSSPDRRRHDGAAASEPAFDSKKEVREGGSWRGSRSPVRKLWNVAAGEEVKLYPLLSLQQQEETSDQDCSEEEEKLVWGQQQQGGANVRVEHFQEGDDALNKAFTDRMCPLPEESQAASDVNCQKNSGRILSAGGGTIDEESKTLKAQRNSLLVEREALERQWREGRVELDRAAQMALSLRTAVESLARSHMRRLSGAGIERSASLKTTIYPESERKSSTSRPPSPSHSAQGSPVPSKESKPTEKKVTREVVGSAERDGAMKEGKRFSPIEIAGEARSTSKRLESSLIAQEAERMKLVTGHMFRSHKSFAKESTLTVPTSVGFSDRTGHRRQVSAILNPEMTAKEEVLYGNGETLVDSSSTTRFYSQSKTSGFEPMETRVGRATSETPKESQDVYYRPSSPSRMSSPRLMERQDRQFRRNRATVQSRNGLGTLMPQRIQPNSSKVHLADAFLYRKTQELALRNYGQLQTGEQGCTSPVPSAALDKENAGVQQIQQKFPQSKVSNQTPVRTKLPALWLASDTEDEGGKPRRSFKAFLVPASRLEEDSQQIGIKVGGSPSHNVAGEEGGFSSTATAVVVGADLPVALNEEGAAPEKMQLKGQELEEGGKELQAEERGIKVQSVGEARSEVGLMAVPLDFGGQLNEEKAVFRADKARSQTPPPGRITRTAWGSGRRSVTPTKPSIRSIWGSGTPSFR